MIPNSVISIGIAAFVNCSGLTFIYYSTEDPISGDWSIFQSYFTDSDFIYTNATLYVPESAIKKCKEINPWKNFAKIEAYDFSNSDVVLAESVKLNKEAEELKVGDTTTLTATVLPENATNKIVTWSSSDETVATVDQTGLVTALKAGTATITAETANGLKATCVVTVETKTGVDGVEADAQISAVAREGAIIVTAPEGMEVEVYSMTGMRVAKTRKHRVEGLSKGVYIVSVGGKAFKVIV